MQSMGALSISNKKLKLMVIIGSVIVVLILAVVTYFAFFHKSTSSTDAAKKSSAAVSAKDLSSLQHVTFTIPTLTGYTARDTGVSGAQDFVSDDGVCELIVGAVPVSQLPGKNLNEIVDPQIKSLKAAGATVVGPDAGKALLLTAAGGSTSYRMPTLNFQFSNKDAHVVVHYSAAILASNDRAVVNRTCVNKSGAVDMARLDALDTIANKITVTTD
jgi:hypothetical protein